MSHAVFGQKGSDSGSVKQEHPVARLKVLLVSTRVYPRVSTRVPLVTIIVDTPHDAVAHLLLGPTHS